MEVALSATIVSATECPDNLLPSPKLLHCIHYLDTAAQNGLSSQHS